MPQIRSASPRRRTFSSGCDISITNPVQSSERLDPPPPTYLQHLDTVPLMGEDFAALPTLYKCQVMGMQHAGLAYEKDNGTLWSLIWDCMDNKPNCTRIRKLRNYRNGRDALIEFIKNYKGDVYKNKEHVNALSMPKKGSYDKDQPYSTFEFFTNIHIEQHEVLM